MPRRYRYRRLDEVEHEEVWRRARGGEPIAEVASALDMTRRGVYVVLARHGGLRPRPRRRSARHLSALEREEISRGVLVGESARAIAGRLRRAPSTISRELLRNGGRRTYRAVRADRRALGQARRPKLAKLLRRPRLRAGAMTA